MRVRHQSPANMSHHGLCDKLNYNRSRKSQIEISFTQTVETKITGTKKVLVENDLKATK